MPPTDVSALYAREFARFAALRAPSPSAQAAAHEHDSVVRRVRGDVFCHDVHEAVLRAQDPALGFRFGTAAGGRAFGLLGVVTATAPTLGHSLRNLLRWEALTSTLGRIGITRFRRFLRLSWRPGANVPAAVIEAVLAGWISFGRFLAGEPIPVIAMELRHARTAAAAAAEAIVHCEVRFDAADNAVVIADDVLDARPRYVDRVLHAALTHWLDDGARLIVAAADDLASHLTAAILRGLQDGDLREERVAANVGLTQRTLQRHLAARGLSFRRALHLVRASIAVVELCSGGGALDVAHRIGFHEQSTLSRAVRRWTGRTPRELRRRFGREFADLRCRVR